MMLSKSLDGRASETLNAKRRSSISTIESVRSTASTSENLRKTASVYQNQRPNKTPTTTKRPSTSTNHTVRQVMAINDNQRPVTAQLRRRPTIEMDVAMSRSALLPQASTMSLAALTLVAAGRIKGKMNHTSEVRSNPGTARNRTGVLGELDSEADPHMLMRRNITVARENNGAASGADWRGDDQVKLSIPPISVYRKCQETPEHGGAVGQLSDVANNVAE